MTLNLRRVLFISDLHIPYHHPGAFDFLRDCAAELRPTAVICTGDEIDAYSWSRYPKDPDVPGPAEELRETRRALKTLFKLFPRAVCCKSNHTYRVPKRAAELGLNSHFLRPIPEVLGAPKTWTWVDHTSVGSALVFHGEGFSGKNATLKASLAYGRPVVMGHLHSQGGLLVRQTEFDATFALNVGCLIDPTAAVFGYAKHTVEKATLGTGAIVEGTPMYIPFTPGA